MLNLANNDSLYGSVENDVESCFSSGKFIGTVIHDRAQPCAQLLADLFHFMCVNVHYAHVRYARKLILRRTYIR